MIKWATINRRLNVKYSDVIGLTLLALAVVLAAPSGYATQTETYLSPLALATNGTTVYVAEYTARQIAVFDAITNTVKQTIALPGQPSGLAFSTENKRLYVTGGGPAGAVYVIDPDEGKVIHSFDAGHSPTAPVLSPDGKTLFVCKRYEDCVLALDLNTGESIDIGVTREPVAAAMTLDGARLLVANLLPATRADGNYITATIDIIDVTTKRNIGSINLSNGSSSLLDICISPDGKYAYTTHILSRYHLPTTQLARGWVNTNAVSVIQIGDMSLLNTFLLDDVDLGSANPWGITTTTDGKWLSVAHSGTHEISLIDREKLHQKLDAFANSGKSDEVPNDLSFLVGLRKRIKLEGKGPRGLAGIGSRIFAAEYFSGTLASVEMTQEGKAHSRSFSLGDEPPVSVVREGELFFHDGTVCFQQWQSCASCHPGEARTDALNWDLLNDGIGNPKNTKSLLHAYDTPPTTATGIRANAEISTRSGIHFILFNQLPEKHAVSVDEYLKSLKALPSPSLVEGKFSPAALRGKEVFEAAECSKCHPAPLFTDMGQHDVDTNTTLEPDTKFDTPTLVEVWRTAPYLHDGRATTMEEVLSDLSHGETFGLSEGELSDLVAYVLSL
jgi:DNA-binding beta-propeller fold protein YncE